MLASAETIEFVAAWLKEWMDKSGKDLKIVLDPVRDSDTAPANLL